MTKEKLWSKDYLFVLMCCMFAAFTHIGFTSLFAVYVLDVGGSYVTAGWMMTAQTIAGVITRLIFGPLIDRWGRKKTFSLGAVLFTINTLAYCFVSDLTGLFALRIFNGISQGIYFSVPATMIADIVPKFRLVDAMGYFGISSALTSAVAPMICLSVYETMGAQPLFVLLTIMAVIAMLCAFAIREHYEVKAIQKKARSAGISSVLEISVLVPAFVGMLLMLGNSSVSNYVIACGMERNIAQISLFFTLNNAAVIVMRLITGKLAERFGRAGLILAGILITSAGTAAIAFSQGMAGMLTASVLLGAGFTLFGQLMQVNILQSVPDNRRGVANSTYALMQEVGTGAGSPLWGAAVEGMGYLWMYLLAAGVTLLGGLIFAGSSLRKR